MSWYEVVAACKVRAFVCLDDVPTDATLAETLRRMIGTGVEEYFGIVREAAIEVESAVAVGELDSIAP